MITRGLSISIPIVKYTKGLYRFYATDMTSLLVPPASVRGMTSLDRDAFTKVIAIPCLKLRNVVISNVTPIVKKYLLKMQRIKPIVTDNNGITVHLDPSKVKTIEDITPTDRELLSLKEENFQTTDLTIKYDNWRTNVILKAVLPEGMEIPTSYSIVGHIIHLNLRDAQLPYKNLIGQIYLDGILNARTVVNKVNNIDSKFRQFTMEILAGDKDTITKVKENGNVYEFDFAQVYWNPRLSTERDRLVSSMNPKDTFYDVFAGVGPFAILAARRKIRTLANDLNPESYSWLQKNAKINKVEKKLTWYNMDGRDFLRNIVKPDILKRRKENASGVEHIAMNLPASAIEFLDILPDWFDEYEIESVCRCLPLMHLYCFVKCEEENCCNEARAMVEEKIGTSLEDSLFNIHYVRNVAPNKNMVCVSFFLTKDILKGEEPATKRLKTEINDESFVNDAITGKDGKEQELSEGWQNQECVQSGDSAKR